MARLTTIVAVIAEQSADLIDAVAAGAGNVGAVRLDSVGDHGDQRELRLRALRQAERRRSVYTLIDFDILQPVIDEWMARLANDDNDLDVESGRTVGASLPEYVLVADDVDDESVHWYHGLLRSYAPRRVVATRPTPSAILDALSHLEPDRSFPPSDVIATAALTYVPTAPTLN